HHEMIFRLLWRELDHARKRMRGLECRDDALEARAELKSDERLVIGSRKIFHALQIVEPRMLGTNAGIVESRRDRMRLLDLAVMDHQEIRPIAGKPAGMAAGRRRGMQAG